MTGLPRVGPSETTTQGSPTDVGAFPLGLSSRSVPGSWPPILSVLVCPGLLIDRTLDEDRVLFAHP